MRHARWDLCGGRRATGVPTATRLELPKTRTSRDSRRLNPNLLETRSARTRSVRGSVCLNSVCPRLGVTVPEAIRSNSRVRGMTFPIESELGIRLRGLLPNQGSRDWTSDGSFGCEQQPPSPTRIDRADFSARADKSTDNVERFQ